MFLGTNGGIDSPVQQKSHSRHPMKENQSRQKNKARFCLALFFYTIYLLLGELNECRIVLDEYQVGIIVDHDISVAAQAYRITDDL